MERLEQLKGELISIDIRLAILDRVIKDVRAEPYNPARLEMLDKNVIPQARGLNEDRAQVVREIRSLLGEPEPEPAVVVCKLAVFKARSGHG